MQRRSLFKLGLASTAALVLAGGAAALLLTPGFENRVLTPAGREVFKAVANAVLDKTLPEAPEARQAALQDLLGRIDGLLAALPTHAQSDLSQLLTLLHTAPGRLALTGLRKPWAVASVADVQSALMSMCLSTLALRQQAYAAMHDIASGAYFSDPANWAVLGYPGPLDI